MSQARFYRASDLVGTIKGRREGQRGILPFGPALLWRKVKDGTFPAPVKLSEGITAWPADKVDAWIQKRSEEAAGDRK